jgi:hypothetical protein
MRVGRRSPSRPRLVNGFAADDRADDLDVAIVHGSTVHGFRSRTAKSASFPSKGFTRPWISADALRARFVVS